MISLATQITLSYLSVLSIAALVGGLLTILLEQPRIDESLTTMSETMEASELENLRERSISLLTTSSSMFGQIVSDVEYQSLYANGIFNETLPITSYYPNYHVSDRWSNPPPGLPSSGVSYNYSQWFKKSSNHSDYLNGSSIMDNVHAPLFRANTEFAAFYMGFNDGLFRILPYSERRSVYPSLEYTCARDGLPVTGYDPRCRGWYVLGENNNATIQFSEPYHGASTNEVMITVAKAVVVNDSLVGVVGADITLQALADTILSAQILDHGYTYLCDSEKQLIVHPDLDYSEVLSVVDKEFKPGDVKARNAFNNFLETSVIGGCNGQSTFLKGGEMWSVTYGPVNGTAYFLLMVVPFSDILQPASSLEEKTDSSMMALIIIVVVIVVSIIMVGSYVAVSIASKITKPVEVFEKILQDVVDPMVTSIDTSAAIFGGYHEINNLHNKINNLFIAVKFSTDAYHNQDYELALEYLQEVENMFDIISQKRALGVLYNNKGNILRRFVGKRDNYASALAALTKAIENARAFVAIASRKLAEERCLKGSTNMKSAHQNLEMFQITLASRLSNYGDCLREAKRFNEAIDALEQSYEMNSSMDNLQGMLQAMGNKGLVYLDQGKLAEAESLLVNAFNMANAAHTEHPTSKTLMSIQFASMNLGLFYFSAASTYEVDGTVQPNSEGQRYVELALSKLYYCLVASNRIQKTVQVTCVFAIDEIFTKYYGNAGRDANERLCGMFPQVLASKYLDVNFLVDVSSSMKDDRIATCEESLYFIIQNKMKNGDSLSLTTFTSKTEVIVPSTRLTAATKSDVINDVLTLRNRLSEDDTYFYKSILQLANSVVTSKPNRVNWIVALTDGEDNEDSTKWQDAKEYCVANKVNLVIVAIGIVDENVMKVLEQLATEPKYYIPAGADVGAIILALTKGFEMATAGNVAMEYL